VDSSGYLYAGTNGGGIFRSKRSTTGVGRTPETGIPEGFRLDQNYPNPFNPSTTITFTLPAQGRVALRVYDMLGREVRTLVNGRQEAGMKTVTFDAGALPSGLYYYRLEAGKSSAVRIMGLVK